MSRWNISKRIKKKVSDVIDKAHRRGITPSLQEIKSNKDRLYGLAQRVTSKSYEFIKSVLEPIPEEQIDPTSEKSQQTETVESSVPAIRIRERSDIEMFSESRQIRFLFHFTRARNLRFILEEGLFSNDKLNAMGREVLDPNRNDGRPDHVCLSISFPNYQMFFRYSSGEQNEWVLLLLCPSLLWENECLFFPYNAAKRELKERPSTSFNNVAAFRDMFDQNIQGNTRSNQIHCSYTTSPQAEVMVPRHVPVSKILEIHFYNSLSPPNRQLLESNNFRYVISRDYFRPRSDFQLWRQH